MFIGIDCFKSAMLKRIRLIRRVKEVLVFNTKLLAIAAIVLPATFFGVLALWGPNGLLVR